MIRRLRRWLTPPDQCTQALEARLHTLEVQYRDLAARLGSVEEDHRLLLTSPTDSSEESQPNLP